MPPPSADSASIFSHGSTSTRSAYSRGPQFTLETFASSDFIVKDFIEALSDSAIPAGRRSAIASSQAAFDPKPLIRTFEAALSRLSSLSEELSSHEADLSGSVRKAEVQHNQNVTSLGKKLDSAIEQFNRLDSSLNGGPGDGLGGEGGGMVAVRIGERLEELDRQRQRAQDAKFLIHCWVEVSEKGSLGSLEDVRRLGGNEGKVRCASIARQLLKLSLRLESEPSPRALGASKSNGVNGSSPKTGSKHQTREIIEKFLEMLEKDLLRQFDDLYRKQNFDEMKECAMALRDFSDGASIIATFVNQHPFFIDRSQLITEEIAADGETWDRLADPDAEPPGIELSLQSLVDEVRLTVQEESFIIKRAFPYHEDVLSRFLQRIFQQSIQQRLEMVLEKAISISSLAFLRSLQSSKSYISTLVEDLKAHGLTEHPEPVSAQVAAVLDQQLDDLFVPYFVGSSYIEREKKNLEELYSSLLFKYTIYHSKKRKVATTYFSSLSQRGKELMNSARDAYTDRLDSTELPASQKKMLLRIAGLKDSDNDKSNKSEIDVTEEDGTLNLPNAKRMLKWLAEGVGRGLELSGGNETPKDAQVLLNLLLTNMGSIYLETALDSTSDLATQQESLKTAPDLAYLPPLSTSISVLSLLQTSITTLLLPLARPNLTIRRELEKSSTAHLSSLESKISSILHKTLDLVLAHVGRLLAGQKKSEFRPRDDEFQELMEGLMSPTCGAVVQFLESVAAGAREALDGGNLRGFLEELAIGVRAALLEHWRKFTVSLTGGIVVTKDATKYSELVRGWFVGPTALAGTGASGVGAATGEREQMSPFERSGGMEVLVEVANLFVVQPEALRERLKPMAASGGGGQGFRGLGGSVEEVRELRRFVERREDVNSVGVQSVLSQV
ncbi:exocyst complex component Sec10 [Aulographum hederae CBS 113979]|uniref:Exocyst complex component Sec10 n=1 Tax=Aulographum hederae CBS 113979 TaxID=1176131 RepID=A0A6G1GZ97_9PEZI|nr:exocyst complex component Sec10 [Aulographum hederae CBS 113979]